MTRWMTYAVSAMAALLLVGGAFRPVSADRPSRPEVGFPAPDFTLMDVEGKPVRLSDYRGKAVFVNFWATWCPPCKAEMPEIQKLQREMPELVILGVDMGDTERSPEAVAAFMKAYGYDWPVPFDAKGQVSSAYDVISIPTSFFLDPNGVIRAKFIGPMSLPLMKDMARQALKGG